MMYGAKHNFRSTMLKRGFLGQGKMNPAHALPEDYNQCADNASLSKPGLGRSIQAFRQLGSIIAEPWLAVVILGILLGGIVCAAAIHIIQKLNRY